MADLRARRGAYLRGRRAEWLAALALMCKGYRIVARRYRTRVGEIDLIARRGRLVLMVEVKCRPALIDAMHAINSVTERRIEAAADHWLAQQRDHASLAIRFDLIAVLPGRWPVHVPRAWEGRAG